MMKQMTFADAEYAGKRKQTRKELFLIEMDQVELWKGLIALIEPYYPKGEGGRPAYPLMAMLRVHLMQNWFGYSDPAMEEALYETTILRQFSGLSLERIPDETTILNFRRLLEKHELAAGILGVINGYLCDRGLSLRQGTLNLYAYAPNPVEWVDALGLSGSGLHAKYRHNENGSLKSATEKIRTEDLGKGTSKNSSSRIFARNLGCEGDDAGHAIGNRLGGSGSKSNVFPQAPSVNRGEFRDFEGDVAESVKRGSNVIVRVVPQYDEGSTRPHSILYQARVDGSTESRIFLNPCSCNC